MFGQPTIDSSATDQIKSPEKSILTLIKNSPVRIVDYSTYLIDWNKSCSSVQNAILDSQKKDGFPIATSKSSITQVFNFLQGLDIENGTFTASDKKIEEQESESMVLGNILHMIPSAILEVLQKPLLASEKLIRHEAFVSTLPVLFEPASAVDAQKPSSNRGEGLVEDSWNQLTEPNVYDGIDAISTSSYFDSLRSGGLNDEELDKRIKILIILIRKLGETFPSSNFDEMIKVREVIGSNIESLFQAIESIVKYFEEDLDLINPLLVKCESEIPVDLKISFVNYAGDAFWFEALNELQMISTVINSRQDMIITSPDGAVVLDFKSHHSSDNARHLFQAKMYILIQACKMLRKAKINENERVYVRDVCLFQDIDFGALKKLIKKIKFNFLDLSTGKVDVVELSEEELSELSELLFQYVQIKIAYKGSAFI